MEKENLLKSKQEISSHFLCHEDEDEKKIHWNNNYYYYCEKLYREKCVVLKGQESALACRQTDKVDDAKNY